MTPSENNTRARLSACIEGRLRDLTDPGAIRHHLDLLAQVRRAPSNDPGLRLAVMLLPEQGMQPMPLDLSRPVMTRGGYIVKILAVLNQPTDAGETIVALVWDPDEDTREVCTYRADGAYFPENGESGLDLVNTAEPARRLHIVAAE